MNWMMNHGPGGRAWLHCLAVVVLAIHLSGCCSLFPDSKLCRPPTPPPPSEPYKMACVETPPATQVSAMSRASCPSGICEPEDNSQGVYKLEGYSYCLNVPGMLPICSEAFINHPPRGPEGLPRVTLRGRSMVPDGSPLHASVSAIVRKLNGAAGSVRVLGIHQDRAGLSITTCPVNTDCKDENLHTYTNNELQLLTLKVTYPEVIRRSLDGQEVVLRPELSFLMKVEPSLPPQDPRTQEDDAIRKYKVSYSVLKDKGEVSPWVNPCDIKELPGSAPFNAGFLPGWTVDRLTAKLTQDPAALTLACGSGAIITCLDWGYTPWNPETWDSSLEGNRKRIRAYGSCLQAKRAAYFVGKGDSRSYTKTGTPIYAQVIHGPESSLPHLEAYWSPEGATCLNQDQRRWRYSIPLPCDKLKHLKPCSFFTKGMFLGQFATSPATLEPKP